MKFQKIAIFLTLLIVLSMCRCKIVSLPFLNGKFMYWLFIVILGGMYFFSKKLNEKHSINHFDIGVLALLCLGLYNFSCISKASIFNVKIGYFAGYLSLYIILRQLFNTRDLIYKSLNFLLYAVSITALLNSLIAILQKNELLPSANEYFKVTGLFFSPNQLGLIVALGLLSTFEIIKKYKNLTGKIAFFLCAIVLVYALYLSQCRGAFLALCIAGMFNLYNSNQKTKSLTKWKMILFSLAVLAGVVLVMKNTNSIKAESASGRLFIIKRSAEQIKNHVFTGHGIDSFSLQYNLAKAHYFEIERPWSEIKNANYVYSANNDFIELTFEWGIIGMLIFILFISALFYFSNLNNQTKTSGSLLLCLLVFALTNTILYVPLFVILGCCYTVIIINTIELKPIYAFNNFMVFRTGLKVFTFLFLGLIFLRIHAEYRLLELYNGTKKVSDLQQIERYVSNIDANGEQLFMAGGILLKNNDTKEGTCYLAHGFESSGKPSLGKILGGIYLRQGEYNKAEQIYKYNVNVEPFRFDARMDLFHFYLQTNKKTEAKEIAKEIINLPIKISSEEIDKYKKEVKFYVEKSTKM